MEFNQQVTISATTALYYSSWKTDTHIRIGSISIRHVTEADDLALISESKSDAQVMIWDADNTYSAGRERYCIHPTKNYILWYTKWKKSDTELGIVMAG